MLTLATIQDVSESHSTMEVYYYIYFLILSLGVVVGWVKIGILNSSTKIMLLLLVVTLFSESATKYLKFTGIDPTPIYHVFQPIELTLFGYAFYLEIKNRLIIALTVGALLFAILNSLLIQQFSEEFNSNAFLLESFLIIFIAFWYLKRLLSEQTPFSFTNYPLFWISTGFTLFNVINLFILGTHNSIANKYPEVNNMFRSIRFLSNYLLYFMFILAFLSQQKRLDASKR